MSALVAFAPGPKGPPSHGETFFFAAISLTCFLSFWGLIWWLLRACVIADGAGLRWRGLGGWKSIGWGGVRDYHEVPPTQTQQGSSTSGPNGTRLPLVISVIETSSGKCGVTSQWSNAHALRKSVALHAVNSRASRWELKGTRTIDPWPRVFDYNTRENRWAPRLWLKLFVAFVVYLLVQPALQMAGTAHLIGWAATLSVAAVYALSVGSLGLIFLLPFAQYRAANQRKDERITVDLNGIVFDTGARRVEAAWADVTGYYKVHGAGLSFRFVVETWHGEFDFLSSLGGAALLQATIQRFATGTALHEWRLPADADALGGEAARWTGGKVGVGSCFYHYRIRTHRTLLLGAGLLCFVCLALAVSVSLGWLPGTPPPITEAGAIGIGAGVALLLGLRAYRWNGIAVDDIGITQRTVFGSRFMAWGQVQEFQFSRTSGGKVVRHGQVLCFAVEIVGCAELTAEIERRVERTKAAI